MFILHESSSSKKRQRDFIESAPEGPTPAAKKQKFTPETELHWDHRPPRFWDTLSKVRLSRGAIREFERRTSQTGQQRRRPVSPRAAASSVGNIQQLKRFSRHGGSDLAHLRGVSILLDETNSHRILTPIVQFASMSSPNDARSRKRSSISSRS